ncbi:hypothetical protein FSP39_007252 [Pinctada imbricata]|uniref:TTF-type domain-containing protein n=1 Tax=Pinctada imbricata TaxID=66713 RepID=A0AA88YFS5_PINIB|nr:hypothetical protein FSP39_007252 [Pinctada imbricata]
MPAAETDCGEMPAAETDCGEMPAAETDCGEMPAAETDCGEMPAAETDCGEVPAADTSIPVDVNVPGVSPVSSSLDIARCISEPGTITDDLKFSLISNRIPHDNYRFPSRTYKDKRRKSGVIHRRCKPEWLKTFEFLCYSESKDGLYCLGCCLFPDTSHRRSKKLISEPYFNWKDAMEDMKEHSTCMYHLSSMAKLHSFIGTHRNPNQRIDLSIRYAESERVKKNRQILSSIIKTLVFCGRQVIALRGHRDDESNRETSSNMGNFKELLQFRADAGDVILQEHLRSCAKNASYISKTSQNELLTCVKMYTQEEIVKEINAQPIGPYYSIQCDEVTDASNWEQLGLVVRYLKDGKPIERILEFIPCENVSGEAICDAIISCLIRVGLDPQKCRSQTMDGAGNMAGKNIGAAARFKAINPKAIYHYCSSHDLNLAISKSCQLKEVQICLDALKKLGIFFKYSPKRSRRLEKAVDEVNEDREEARKIDKKKFKVYSETRWVEKHTTLQAFDDLYEPILLCLDAISSKERGWDSKAVVEANGLLHKISEPIFVAAFQTILHYFRYMAGLSRKLQGSSLDILQGYRMVKDIREIILDSRANDTDYDQVYCRMDKMASSSSTPLKVPRQCLQQTQRSNVPASTTKEYFKRSVFIPYVDALIQQLEMRFSNLAEQSTKALLLIPANMAHISQSDINDLKEIYGSDMPDVESLGQELVLWKHMWSRQDEQERPQTLTGTLQSPRSCPTMYPNIMTALQLMLLTSVTSSSVERANSSLRFIKGYLRTTMSEDRFNSLMLLFIHRDIMVDIEKVIDTFARRNPRRMMLQSPLGEVA